MIFGRYRLFRSMLAIVGIVFGGSFLVSCASSRPEDVPAPAPILAKTVWDDASGHGAPADSIGRNLSMVLGRRDDMVVLAADSQLNASGPRGRGNGAGAQRHKGGHHGGNMSAMGGEGVYGGGTPEKSREEELQATSLRLLLAGTVERWDVDSERTELDALSRPGTSLDSLCRGPMCLSLRLVSKATGRVVWKKTEGCSSSPSAHASILDSTESSGAGWMANFARCREEVLRSSAYDVAQAALDLAHKAAVSEAKARADR